MLHRILAILLAVMILIPACASAETADESPLYLLVSRSETGEETPLGSAVLFLDQTTLLTTVWTIRNGHEVFAVGAGGTFGVKYPVHPTEQSELLLLILDKASPAQPLMLGQPGSTMSVMGHDALCQPVFAPAAYPAPAAARGSNFLLFTAPTALMPGSVLLNEMGAVAAITTSAYGEGVNRYFALDGNAMLRELTAMQEEGAPQDDTEWIDDFTLTPDKGLVEADWSGCSLTCERDDCVLTLYLMDTGNPFYSYLPLEKGSTSATLYMAPGRSYRVWLQHAHGEATNTGVSPVTPNQTIDMPPAEKFNLHQYHDSDIYLATAPAQDAAAATNTFLPPMETITAQALTDPSTAVFLQVFSTYTVEENIDAALLITLETPQGYCLMVPAGFIFDTTLQQNDVWNAEISSLFADCAAFSPSGALDSGEYTVRYYLDGALANEFTFTLE